MQINFRQGIISYGTSGGLQSFLVISGSNVNLSVSTGVVNVAFADKIEDYLLTESANVPNAWLGPFTVDTWLFWNIDSLTGLRTFGTTLLKPVFGASPPASPQEGQHWFDTVNTVMNVFQSGSFRPAIRVFAAKVNGVVFTPLGDATNFPATPYAGTQVGISGTATLAGRIVFDGTGIPIRKSNNTFFTTEDQFFISGSPVNVIKLEANILSATAVANLSAYYVIKIVGFGQINYAGYNDLQDQLIGVLVENTITGTVGNFVTQGTITNLAWNWSTPGEPLWVSTSGQLVETDPHLTDPITYPIGKPPCARVITPTTIFFDQGLGGKGDQGVPGPSVLATNSVFGATKLSLAAASPSNPIACGDNDPRLTNARTPLAHTHPATDVTFAPYLTIIGPNTQLAIQQLTDQKLNLTGGTLTGTLFLAADPTTALQAATKQYVDTTAGTSKVSKSGDSMTGQLILLYIPTDPNAAIPKDYVDSHTWDWTTQITGKPTTLAGYGITNAVTNILGAPSVREDIFANIGTAVGFTGQLFVATDTKVLYRSNGATWDAIGATGSGHELSSITSAVGGNTISNLAFAQVWNWLLTANTTAFKFGETAPSTGGSGSQFLLDIETLVASTADPFRVVVQGVENFKIASTGAWMVQGSTGTLGKVITSNGAAAPSWQFVAWSTITGTPTTLAGYGITDAYTQTQSDGRYLQLAGGTMTGNITLTTATNKIINAQLQQYSETKVVLTPGLGANTLDLSLGNTFTLSLTTVGAITLSTTNVPTGTVTVLISLSTTGTGAATTITWPVTTKWAGGTPPTVTTTSGKVDIYTLISYDNGVTWLGMVAGQIMF